MAKAC